MFHGFLTFEDCVAQAADQENYDENTTITDPTWEDVETHISRMDGYDRSSVGLSHGDDIQSEQLMIIGYGLNGEYVCSVVTDDENYLTNPSISDRSPRVYVMGQESRTKANRFVTREAVLRAAKYYYDNKDLCPDLVWERTW